MKLSLLGAMTFASYGIQGDAFVVDRPVPTYPKRISSTIPLSLSQQTVRKSSLGVLSPARPRLAPLCCTTQPSTLEEMQEKQKAAARIGDKFSRDWASFYVTPGMISEDPEYFRLYAYLICKIDVLVDDFPEWKNFLRPEAEAEFNSRKGSYASGDVKKFGPVMDFVLEAQETYTELWDKMEALYGSDTPQAMEIIDEGLLKYIQCTDDLAFLDTPKALTKKYSLKDYMRMRAWTFATTPLIRCLWNGLDVIPKDGRIQDACIACSLVNDLYDYLRDKEESKQLSVWHYFDTVYDAVEYVRPLYYEIYDRVGPELRLFLDCTMKYQQDERIQETRGYDIEWYEKLNSNFNHLLIRES